MDHEQLAGKLLQDLRSVIDDMAAARTNKGLWSQLIRDADIVEEYADKLQEIWCEIFVATDADLAA